MKRKGGSGKRKGGNFEREVCKRLSDWWSPGRSDIFWRTATSGGRSTIRSKTGKSTYGQAGDICASDPIGTPLTELIAFELKTGYAKVSPMDLLDTDNENKVSQFHLWVEQVIGSAEQSGVPYWIIIHNRPRRETMLYMPKELHRALNNEPPVSCSVLIRRGGLNFYGFQLEAFLSWVDRQTIQKLHSDLRRSS